MHGETDLAVLLATLRPALDEGDWVFCTLPDGRYGDGAELAPVATVAEDEGLTLVIAEDRARAAGLPYDGVFARIVLRVHSSLHAVGLTAAVATRLAERGISANVIAGRHHDHVFVPRERAAEAMAVLEGVGRG